MANDQPAPGERLEIDAGGTVSVRPFALPLSAALSEQSKARFATMFSTPEALGLKDPGVCTTEPEFKAAVDALRETLDEGMARPASERLLAAMPVDVSRERV